MNLTYTLKLLSRTAIAMPELYIIIKNYPQLNELPIIFPSENKNQSAPLFSRHKVSTKANYNETKLLIETVTIRWNDHFSNSRLPKLKTSFPIPTLELSDAKVLGLFPFLVKKNSITGDKKSNPWV